MLSKTNNIHEVSINKDLEDTITLSLTAFSWSSAINETLPNQLLAYSYTFLNSNECLFLLNTSVCLSTALADLGVTYRTGLIQAVYYQHSDGGVHFYTLDIVTPDWQLTQSIHSRTFTQQSTLSIITSILTHYDFDWQVSDALLASERFNASLPMRTQSNLSDWDFIKGVLTDIGAFALWQPGDSVDNLGTWYLASRLDELEQSVMHYRYAQSSIQSGQDTINTLQMSVKQLGSATVQVKADGLATDIIYEGQAADESPLALDDSTILFGSPSRINSDEAAAQLAAQWIAANNCQRETYRAMGAMRGVHTGSSVSISDLPAIGGLSAHCLDAHVTGIEPDSDSVSYNNRTFIQDWLRKVTQHRFISIPEHGYEILFETGIWASATLLRATTPYCPYPSSLSLVSNSYIGLTQARTGDTTTPSYESHVTDNGLQQTITTPVWSGISPHDDGTTPPLRSLQLSSGASHGWQFSPRLGQSVLLNYWYGDIDSPVITRSIYDGIGMGDVDDKDITCLDAGRSNRHNLKNGASPRWHCGALGHSQIQEDDNHSGWISGIAQYGLSTDSEVAFSFDDTPSKVGLQWTVNTGGRANIEMPTITDQAIFAADEHVLELGVLRHRFSNHQSTDSGQGINLATDHGLQITGDTGVLLSTFDIRHSQSEHESAWVNDAGQRQLRMGTELSEIFKEAKQAHLQSTQAMNIANPSIDAFQTAAQVIDDTLNTEILGAPDVLLVTKDSILASASNTLWTAKTIVRQSGATQSDVVAGNYMLMANTIDSLSGAGGQADLSGLHISANTKPVAIQAQGGELQLHSQQSMTIGSESGQVNLSSPKRIKLQTSGGASITIDDGGIKLVCPGTIKVLAVKKSLMSGAKVNAPVVALPTSGLFSRRFDFSQLLEESILTVGREYKIINHTKGTEFNNVLPEDGRTPRIYGTEQDQIEVIIIGHEDAEELLMIENEIDNSNHDHEDEECCAPEEDDDTTESQPDSYTNLDDNLEDDYYEFGN